MRLLAISGLVLSMAACTTSSVPDSGAEATGVGFGNYNTYQQERAAREAALQSGAAGAPLSALNTAAATPTSDAEALAAQTRAALGAGAGTPPNTTSVPTALSDEQSFDAVSNRETIESDRIRLEQRRAQFEQVAPTALPDRPAETGPNIVAYALSTSHPAGQAVYNRSRLFGGNGRNCNRYSTANEAQAAFLAAGGPQRDRKGLDPDGDGYACGWDPTPFRLASQARAGGT